MERRDCEQGSAAAQLRSPVHHSRSNKGLGNIVSRPVWGRNQATPKSKRHTFRKEIELEQQQRMKSD